jgi:prepilin-type N-terminal cleavage/methylation domain-containing protein
VPGIKIRATCADGAEMLLRSPLRGACPRLANEQSGFTLVELLIALVILGVLATVAVPSLLGYRARAESSVAAANIRAALPAVLAYYSDHGTYAGMTEARLREIDAGLELDPLVPVMQTATSYCIASTVAARTWRASSSDLAAVMGACLPAAALACYHGGWQVLGQGPADPFTSEQECIDFAVGGGAPVIVSTG